MAPEFSPDTADVVVRMLNSGEYESARECLSRHLPIDAAGRVDHETLLGRAAALSGRHQEARDHLLRALWSGRRLQRSRVKLRGDICSLLLNAGDLVRAQRELRRALTEIRLKQHDLEQEARLLSYQGGIYRRRGMVGTSIRVHEEALALARKRGVVSWGNFAVNLATSLYVHGELDRAGRLLGDLLDHPEVFLPSGYPYARVVLAIIALENDDVAGAERVLAPILEQADRMEHPSRLVLLLCRVDCLVRRGRPQEALVLLETEAGSVEEPSAALAASGIVVKMAEVLHELGRHEEALRLAQKAVLLGRASDPFDLTHALRVAAQCQASLGRMDAARTTLAESFAILRTSDYNLERRNLARTAESLGIDVESVDGGSVVSDAESGIGTGTVPQWMALRDGRSFLTVDPNLVRHIQRSAASSIPVLIEGESGTGKELVAHLIHEQGLPSKDPFVVVDCTTLHSDLAESELFGATRGAYTGAVTRHGLVEAADGGTLFLDEVTELTLRLQAKLLRLLQEGTYRRLGETKERRTEVRIVAATNRDVEQAVRIGRLRLDLFHRLNGHRVMLRPLRERPRERRLLADEVARAAGLLGVSSEGHRLLGAYPWPGNVRELQMLIRVAASAIAPGGWLDASDLRRAEPKLARIPEQKSLQSMRDETDRTGLTRALDQNGGNVAAAARSLGLSRQGFYKAMRRAGIRRINSYKVRVM